MLTRPDASLQVIPREPHNVARAPGVDTGDPTGANRGPRARVVRL